MAAREPWPTELRLSKADKVLQVSFDDGKTYVLPAELLRVESPSAEVQGHGGGKMVPAGRRHVNVIDIEMVGNYAVRLSFDDLHDTGLYTWRYLRELGENQAEIWQRYLDALEKQGLSRDP